MKKLLFLIAISILISCSSDSESASCSSISSFTVTQELDQLKFNMVTTGTPTSYQLSYSYSSEFDPNNSSMIEVQTNNSSLSLGSLSSGSQTIYFYVRTICPDGSLGPWSAKRSIYINDYCVRPRNLTYTDYLQWDDYDGSSYQVQYGVSGFNLGSGTTISTNERYLYDIPMNGNTTYDFYVRTNCGGSSGWSGWAGPHTRFNQNTQFMCTTPTGLYHNIIGTGGQVGLYWNHNGETLFEYTLVLAHQTPEQGIINTNGTGSTPTYFINSGYNYKFYVRAVCSNGNRTAWASYVFSI